MITTESTCQDWRTPPDLFAKLNEIYNFDCDVCASDENHLCQSYFTEEKSALDPLSVWGRRCFMNPPYGREIKHFMRAAYERTQELYPLVEVAVCLIPARTSSHWFHDLVFSGAATTVTFIDGRLKFSGNENVAPFASCIVEYSGQAYNSMIDLGREIGGHTYFVCNA